MVAITTSIFNAYVPSHLEELGICISDPDHLIKTNSQQEKSEVQDDARVILSEGYDRQMIVLCACGVAQVVVAILMWKKN